MIAANRQGDAASSTPERRRRAGTGFCDGAAAVEFALIMPILMAMLVMMIDLGSGGYVSACLQTAAQAGTTYAERHGWNEHQISLAASNATGLPALTVAATKTCDCVTGTEIVTSPCGSTCPAGGAAGVFVAVHVSTEYAPLIPYPGIGRSITLGASSIVRIN